MTTATKHKKGWRSRVVRDNPRNSAGETLHQTSINALKPGDRGFDYDLYNLAIEAGIIEPGRFYSADRCALQRCWWRSFKRVADEGRQLFAGGVER